MSNKPLNFLIIAVTAIFMFGCNAPKKTNTESTPLVKEEGAQLTYSLPSPILDGTVSVEKTMNDRRSRRSYVDRAISAEQLSQILWSAYGINLPRPDVANLRGGLRTAPSAGARYPFEIYVLVGKVTGIETGLYRYIADGHKIIRVSEKDKRADLAAAALNQTMISDAPISLFYSAIYSRMTDRYGDRGRERYVCIDLGHSSQNVYLQAEALKLGTCAIGAFIDDRVKAVMELPAEEEPLYIMPVGYFFEK